MQTPYLSSCLCSVADIQVENHFFKKGEVGMEGNRKRTLTRMYAYTIIQPSPHLSLLTISLSVAKQLSGINGIIGLINIAGLLPKRCRDDV